MPIVGQSATYPPTLGSPLSAAPAPSTGVAYSVIRLWDTGNQPPTTWARHGGTVGLNGGIVTGTGTSFNYAPGETIFIHGLVDGNGVPHGCTITAVNSATRLTVQDGIGSGTLCATGTIASGAPYRVINFKKFDPAVAAAKTNGAKVMFTWATWPSDMTIPPTDPQCRGGSGACSPTALIATTQICDAQVFEFGRRENDCELRDIIASYHVHMADLGYGFDYAETGNEMNLWDNGQGLCPGASCPSPPLTSVTDHSQFNGTLAQLAQQSDNIADVINGPVNGLKARGYAAAVNEKVLAFSVTSMGTCAPGQGASGVDTQAAVFPLMHQDLYDGVAIHLYLGHNPESLVPCLANYASFLASSNFAGKIVVQTEFASDGKADQSFNGCGLAQAQRSSGITTLTLQAGSKPLDECSISAGSVVDVRGVPGGFERAGITVTAINNVSGGTISYPDPGLPDAFVQLQGSGNGDVVLSANVQKEADFYMRRVLLEWGARVTSLTIMYGVMDNRIGTLCDEWPPSGTPGSCGAPRQGLTSLGEALKWIANDNLRQSCTQNGTVWTCQYNKSDPSSGSGYSSQAVWNTAGPSAFSCGAFLTWLDQNGNKRTCSGTVRIGPTPILLQNTL